MSNKVTLVSTTVVQSPLVDSKGLPTRIFQSWLAGITKGNNSLASSGVNAVIPLAKLTGGGANGSLTFVNGILTAFTPPT